MYDLLIRDGRIYDGTGSPAYSADIGVADGEIVAIGRLEGEAAKYYLNAANSAVWRALEKRSKNAAELRKLVFPDIAG